MDLQAAAFLYVEKIIKETPLMKALLLDAATFDVLSITATKTELYAAEVVMVEELEKFVSSPPDPQIASLNCVMIVRPDRESIELICRELQKPHFQKYSLFFTNAIGDASLRQIAANDANGIVTCVQEVFLDFLPTNKRLFSLGMRDISHVRRGMGAARVAEGLFAALASLNVKPAIRYDARSDTCRAIASELGRMTGDLVKGSIKGATVLVLDRRSDPVTPLLHSCHFIPMVHDLLGVEKNAVMVDADLRVLDERGCEKAGRVNTAYIGDVSEIIDGWIGDLRSLEQDVSSEWQGDIREAAQDKVLKAMRVGGEKSFAGNFIAVNGAIQEMIIDHEIPALAQLEQAITATSEAKQHCEEVKAMIANPKVVNMDALRLAILYCLRHETSSSVRIVMDALRAREGWHGEELSYWDTLREVSDRKVRDDIFSNKTFTAKIRAGIRSMRDDRGQFERFHVPLESILKKLKQQELSEQAYPFQGGSGGGRQTSRVIVFFVGGATYEEMVLASTISSPDFDVIVGGTTIHNGESFLKYEVAPFNH